MVLNEHFPNIIYSAYGLTSFFAEKDILKRSRFMMTVRNYQEGVRCLL